MPLREGPADIYVAAGNVTDVAVRRFLQVPCIECILRRKRLIYARRLMVHGPPALQALFQCRVGTCDAPLPWVRQLLNDLCHLQRYHGQKLSEMPDPRQQPKAWPLLIIEFPQEWRELVNSYTEYENPCTSSVVQPPNDLYEFSCSLCVGGPAFKSAKALASHVRIKHKVTNPLNTYVDDSGICPVCHTNFFSRARVLTHFSETRIRNKSGRRFPTP